jgi:hypothetical protein
MGASYTTYAAGAVLIAVPVAILYLALQKYFVSGLTSAVLKDNHMKRLTPAACCLSGMQFFRRFAGRGRAANARFSGMPADFIKGADISTLLDAEKHGAKFYNHNNQRRIRSPF